MTLILGDCLEEMQHIPDKTIDLVLTDPPYGTTACKWDAVIPLEPMWAQLKRIIKDNGVIVLFGSQPFTSVLVASNLQMFKYDWVYRKSKVTNVLNAKHQPLRNKEDILVFYKGSPVYNPQGLKAVNKQQSTGATKANREGNATGKITPTGVEPHLQGTYFQENGNHPRQVLDIKSPGATVHPTQKPVELMEYLVKTYTNEGDTVLDFTMESGTTGVACKTLDRRFIGIEQDERYFSIAKERICSTPANWFE